MTQKLNIGSNPIYIETLLNIIRSSVQSAPDYDIILLYALSFLLNLSDLSPNCFYKKENWIYIFLF